MDNDRTLQGVPTDTVAFSSTVVIKCCICPFPHSFIDAHSACMAQDVDPQPIIIFVDHGIVTLANVVCCFRSSSLVAWRTVELGNSTRESLCGRGEKTPGLRGKTQEEVVETTTLARVLWSEEGREKQLFRIWCAVEGCLFRVVTWCLNQYWRDVVDD